jgi:hypothetical protein
MTRVVLIALCLVAFAAAANAEVYVVTPPHATPWKRIDIAPTAAIEMPPDQSPGHLSDSLISQTEVPGATMALFFARADRAGPIRHISSRSFAHPTGPTTSTFLSGGPPARSHRRWNRRAPTCRALRFVLNRAATPSAKRIRNIRITAGGGKTTPSAPAPNPAPGHGRSSHRPSSG